MVPKVAGKGTSFKGAGQYYLHDKGANTSERVVFTHTENLPTNDPELALKAMAWTALHQDEIKARAGVKASGRKSAQSVYTYSLSWAPDEQPGREEMIAAGRETLRALGLEDHEALMTAHDDEPHPHLHVIVNRVHPETGIMAPLNKDYLVLSRWAEDFEKRQGEIRCEQRVENNEKRRKGQFVRHRETVAAARHRARKMDGERARFVRQAEAANLAATHRGEQLALVHQYGQRARRLFAVGQRRAALLRAHIREQNRPQWAALFRRQRSEWRALNEHQRSAYLRLRYLLRHRGHGVLEAGDSGLTETMREALKAVIGRDNPHGALSRRHRAERQDLAERIGVQRRLAMRKIREEYRRDLAQLDREEDQLARQQREQVQALKDKHSRESQERAKAFREGRDIDPSRAQARQAVLGEFERSAWQNIRKARHRRAEEKKRGRDRNGDGGRERE